MKTTMRFLTVASVLGLAACGDDAPTTPTTPPPVVNVPNVAGTYAAANMWLVQFQRTSDGFRSSYTCTGNLTLAQGVAVGGRAPLSGFGVVGAPCAAISYQLTGSIDSTGAVTLRGDGPRPPACAAPGVTTYEGIITNRTLSVRSTETVTAACSGDVEGEHRLDYIVSGNRTS